MNAGRAGVFDDDDADALDVSRTTTVNGDDTDATHAVRQVFLSLASGMITISRIG